MCLPLAVSVMIAVGVTSGFLNQYQLIMDTLQGTSANGPIRWPDEKLGTLVEQLPVSIGLDPFLFGRVSTSLPQRCLIS